MKILQIKRKQLSNCSIGSIILDDRILYTLERPWVCNDPEEYRAGEPFKSCVPYGHYELKPHSSERYPNVWALVNPDLGVFHTKNQTTYASDRYGILIHAGNYVHDVSGCIAVGNGVIFEQSEGRYILRGSMNALNHLRTILDDYQYVEISPFE